MQLKNIYVAGKFIIGQVGHKYVFTAHGDKFFGGEESKDYRSRVYDSPTVADLIEAAEESVDVTKDRQHIFLEGYEITADQEPQGENVGEIAILFGS